MSVRIHINTPAPSKPGRSPEALYSPDLVERAVRAALAAEGRDEGELSVTLLDDAAMTELNSRYLSRDRPTDVLAFGMHEAGDPVMGDVYIGWDQALRQAAELGVDPAEELARLAVHGTLHVLGHDHPEGADRETSPMWRLQERVLAGVLERSGA